MYNFSILANKYEIPEYIEYSLRFFSILVHSSYFIYCVGWAIGAKTFNKCIYLIQHFDRSSLHYSILSACNSMAMVSSVFGEESEDWDCYKKIRCDLRRTEKEFLIESVMKGNSCGLWFHWQNVKRWKTIAIECVNKVYGELLDEDIES